MKALLILVMMILSLSALAEPHLTGSVYLDNRRGLIQCKLQLTNIPGSGSYALLLNRGFNVKSFTHHGEILDFRTQSEDTNIRYVFSPVSPDSIYMEYTGAFPVYRGSERTNSDDMGQIAIREGILRATVQSNFIPALVDVKTNRQLTSYTYDLDVTSETEQTVFLNGCAPQTGKSLRFRSSVPVDFLIYAGRYSIAKRNNLYVLNSVLPPAHIDILGEVTASISRYYARIMHMPYNGDITFAQIFSIGPKEQYTEWAFTVTPVIVMDIEGLSRKIDLQSRTITDVNTFRMIAHEMAHKYFMQQLNAMGTKKLWLFYHEALAQYMAYKAVEELISKSAYDSILRTSTFTDEYRKRRFIPFEQIEKTQKDLTNQAYYYYPMYPVGFEKMFGKEKAFQLLRLLVADSRSFSNDTYYFIARAARVAGNPGRFKQYQRQVLESENCLAAVERFSMSH